MEDIIKVIGILLEFPQSLITYLVALFGVAKFVIQPLWKLKERIK